MFVSRKYALATALMLGFSVSASAAVIPGSTIRRVLTRPTTVSSPAVPTTTVVPTPPTTVAPTSTLPSAFVLPRLTKPRPGGSEGCGPRPI